MRYGFSKKTLSTHTVEELTAKKTRITLITCLIFVVQISYSSIFPYAWEIGNYVISQDFGYYALVFAFAWTALNAMFMSNQIQAIENGDDPNRLEVGTVGKKEPPTKLTKFINQGIYILGAVVVCCLIWLSISIYKDTGTSPKSEQARYTKILAKLEAKQCTLDGYHKKYNGMAKPIYVEKTKKNGYTIKHLTNDVSKRTSISSNFKGGFAVYQCANGTVEKSQYIFRVLIK